MLKYLPFFILFVLLTTPSTSFSWFGGINTFDECILEKMPGIDGNGAARAILSSCNQKYPERSEPENKLGIFGPKNYDDCVFKHIKGKESEIAAGAIMGSCYQIFPE